MLRANVSTNSERYISKMVSFGSVGGINIKSRKNTMNMPASYVLARCPKYTDLSPRSKIHQELLLWMDYQDCANSLTNGPDALASATAAEVGGLSVCDADDPGATGIPLSNLLIPGGQADTADWLETIFRMAADLVENEKTPQDEK